MFHVFEYSVFYPCCKYEIRKDTSSHLPSPPTPPSRVTARQGPPQTLVPPRDTAVSLQGGLVPETIYEGRDSIIFFTYFFKFFTYSFMFPTYFFIFFTYFPHIPSYFSHISTCFSHKVTHSVVATTLNSGHFTPF